jgi:hypothetical protein
MGLNPWQRHAQENDRRWAVRIGYFFWFLGYYVCAGLCVIAYRTVQEAPRSLRAWAVAAVLVALGAKIAYELRNFYRRIRFLADGGDPLM